MKDLKIGEDVLIVKAADKSLVGTYGKLVNVNDDTNMCAVTYKDKGEDIVRWVTQDQVEVFTKNVGRCDLNGYENAFFDITEEMRQTFLEKNRDYGSSFSDTVKKFGINVAIARIHDKYMRLENMAIGKQMNVMESMEDTLLDMASYCILTLMELRDNPLQEKDFNV